MIPMRTSSVFKSRWMALVWAAGVLWFAYSVAGSEPQGGSSGAQEPADVTGATISDEDAKKFVEVVNGL
jgi:hypothetical protein